MKVAVTGSRGLIGNHVRLRLLEEGHEVTEWDTKSGKNISDFTLDGEDYVIHLAAYADVRASIENPQKYWDNNVENTTAIQKTCYYNHVPLLYASSSCIHNWSLSPYGISKKVNEETAFPNQVGLRFTTVYGEGARESMLIGRLLKHEVSYLTNHVRDFIHVNDVVDVIMLMMSKDIRLLAPTYDIGTGNGVVVSELGEIVGLDVPTQEGYECEAQNNTADITPLKELGWNPTIDVKKYLQERKKVV